MARVMVPPNITYQMLVDYLQRKCGMDSIVGITKVVYRYSGQMFQLRNDADVSCFLRNALALTNPPTLYVYDDDTVGGGSNVVGGSNTGDNPDVYAPEQSQTPYEPQFDEQSQTPYASQYDPAFFSEPGYGMPDYNPSVVPETQEPVPERDDELDEAEEDEAEEDFDQDPDESYVYELGIPDVHTDEEGEETSEPNPVRSYGGVNDFIGMPPLFQKTNSPTADQTKHPFIIHVVEE